MKFQRPDETITIDVQRDLDRLQATCRISIKKKPRGSWEKTHEGVRTFEIALDLVAPLLKTSVEAGVFLEHPEYDGILIWTSQWPDIVNRFEHLIV